MVSLDGPLWSQPAWALADAVRTKEISSTELVTQCLDRIERSQGDVNSFIHIARDDALRTAAAIDDAVACGDDPGPLAGVPLGVKELSPVAGWPWTDGSRVFADRIATHTNHHTERLVASGAVLVGSTAASEFGSTNFTRTLIHGTTRNPWDLTRTSGGSSGGSSAALAAGLVPLATGGDGGGSIRIPASYTGLPGLKPTWGRITKGPYVSQADLTSVTGPMTTTVRDIARWLDCTVGYDVHDRWSLPHPGFSFEDGLLASADEMALNGLTVSWCPAVAGAVCDPEVEEITAVAMADLVKLAGLRQVDRQLEYPRPSTSWGISGSQDLYRELAPHLPEAYDVVTPWVRMAIDASELLNRRRYARAMADRFAIEHALEDFFADVDLAMTPTTATAAFAADGPPPMQIAGVDVGPMGSVPYTMAFNLIGQPAISLPVGFTGDGLPVGLQIAARHHEEPVLLALAALWERERPWPRFAPYADSL